MNALQRIFSAYIDGKGLRVFQYRLFSQYPLTVIKFAKTSEEVRPNISRISEMQSLYQHFTYSKWRQKRFMESFRWWPYKDEVYSYERQW